MSLETMMAAPVRAGHVFQGPDAERRGASVDAGGEHAEIVGQGAVGKLCDA